MTEDKVKIRVVTHLFSNGKKRTRGLKMALLKIGRSSPSPCGHDKSTGGIIPAFASEWNNFL